MKPFDSKILQQAAARLQNGDVVALPTETVYGLAASLHSEPGLRKVFALKQRPFFDPLIVHVDSFAMAQTVASEWPPLADFLARCFWPGPLTLVLPKQPNVSELITSGLDTVAIRYPQHPLFLEMIRLTQSPLAAPSANRFGRTSPTQASHVREEFSFHKDLLVIDGGPCTIGVESTVLAFTKDQGQVKILRPGAITAENIRAVLRRWAQPVEVIATESDASPGHLKHHYMPELPLVLVNNMEEEEIRSRLQLQTGLEKIHLNERPEIAARELYSQLRKASAVANTGALYVRFLPHMTTDLWVAIWDRLTRAASYDWR